MGRSAVVVRAAAFVTAAVAAYVLVLAIVDNEPLPEAPAEPKTIPRAGT